MKRSVAIGSAAAIVLATVVVVLAATGSLGRMFGLSGGDAGAEQVLAMDIMPMEIGDEQCGYFDDKGAQAFAGQFDNAGPFFERSGLAIVELGGKYGIIDRKGAYTANPQFEEMNAADGNKLFYARLDDKWGLVDETGKYIVNPQFTGVDPFAEDGLAAAGSGDKVGMIDKTGKWIIQPKFDEIRITYPDDVYAQLPVYFFDDLAAARIDKKWGFIDREGNWRINPQFADVGRFDGSGMAPAAQVKGDGEVVWGFIGEDGKWAINPQFATLYHFREAPLAAVSSGDNGWGFIGRDGKYTINPQFAAVGYFTDGSGKQLAPAAKKSEPDSFGYVDEKGAFAINPQFAYAAPFDRNKRALVKFGDNWGLIGRDGTFVVNPSYVSLAAIKGTDLYLFRAEAAGGSDEEDEDEFSIRFGLVDAKGKERVVWTGMPCFAS
jgi:hypothetical protein